LAPFFCTEYKMEDQLQLVLNVTFTCAAIITLVIGVVVRKRLNHVSRGGLVGWVCGVLLGYFTLLIVTNIF
jgi:threonine/homoserine/homoserine lactone efflux protein